MHGLILLPYKTLAFVSAAGTGLTSALICWELETAALPLPEVEGCRSEGKRMG